MHRHFAAMCSARACVCVFVCVRVCGVCVSRAGSCCGKSPRYSGRSAMVGHVSSLGVPSTCHMARWYARGLRAWLRLRLRVGLRG